MTREGTSWRWHRTALAATAFVHAMFAVAALAPRGTPVPMPRDEALQVTWIERPAAPPRAAAPPRPAAAPAAAARPSPATKPGFRRGAQRPEAGPAPAPEPSRPLSAVFVEQGRAFARGQAEADFTRNPLTDRRDRIDAPAERIAMRDPLTPARVVAAVGQLFGGPDYETSPCPRIRRNITALGPGGDSAALREELTRFHRDCQR